MLDVAPSAFPTCPSDEHVLRVAVLSDLHAFDKTSHGTVAPFPSFLDIGAPETPPGQHPIASLRQHITALDLRADLLLCAGDLAEKASPAATKYAWTAVHGIGTCLGATVVGTAGNHDVDSRYQYNDHDAKGMLQSLDPPFPVCCEASCDRYWSRHFIILTLCKCRLVVLNSSAYHGAGPPPNETPPEYYILLCHHHPMPLEEYGLGAADIMAGGHDLIHLLGSGQRGEWFIVHGHKHFPKLSYAHGTTATTPIVLAAGSLCVKPNPNVSHGGRNQFYMLDFPLDEFPSYGLVGRFRAWDWNLGHGWQPAQPHSGLPHEGGFGYREKPMVLAQGIADACKTRPKTEWLTIMARFPRLDYLLPNDMEALIRELETRHALQVLKVTGGRIHQIDNPHYDAQ